MAEETKGTQTTVETSGNNVQDNQQKAGTETTPTVEELMTQLATEKAEKEKYKSANDKLSKSEAEMKRQLRAKQTAEERAAEEQAEAQKKADEELETVRKELNQMKAENAYKNIQNEKTVKSLIDAVSDADHNAIAIIIENEKKMAVKEAEAKWLKTRPQVNSGKYESMSKEEILAIPDRDERRKAIAENQDLF